MSALVLTGSGTLPVMVDVEHIASLDWQRLGEHVAARRAELRLSQAKLAEQAGVTDKTVQSAEKGTVPKSRYPRSLAHIVRALGWAAGSDLAILHGGTATLRDDVLSTDSDGDADTLFIVRNIDHAGPRTKKAIRAVLENDLERDENHN